MSEAEKELQGIKDHNARNTAMRLMANALLAHGNLDDALDYLRRSNMRTSDVHTRAALACIKVGRFDDAVRLGLHGDRAPLVREFSRLERWGDARKIVADGEAPGMTPEIILAMCRQGQAERGAGGDEAAEPRTRSSSSLPGETRRDLGGEC